MDIRTISREELKKKLDAGDDFRLVMALNEWSYRAMRIPGSIHFNTPAEARAGLDKDDEIVVYCSNPACVGSQFFYHALVSGGYTNVRRYEGGLADWQDAAYAFEGDAVE